MRLLPFLLLYAFFTGLFPLQAAHAAQYTFTPIATSRGPLISFAGAAINDNGAVTFSGNLQAGTGTPGTGVFFWNGGSPITVALNQIADPTSQFTSIDSSPTINNAGTVAFHAGLPTPGGLLIEYGGVYTWNGATIDSLYEKSETGFWYLGSPAINNAGTAAFYGRVDAHQRVGVFKGDGGQTTTIADSTLFAQFPEEKPAINDSGLVAFSANRAPDADPGIFLGDGGAITTVADTTGQFSELFPGGPVMNNNNVVAFHAFLDTGELGIFTYENGIIERVVDDSGPFEFFFSALRRAYTGLAINDSGVVAFDAAFDGDPFNSGVFTGPDPVVDKVIQVGDTLGDSTVTSVLLSGRGGNRALNNAGQLVFYAELSDGSSGLYLASPSSLPPSAGLVAAVLPSSRSVRLGSPASAFATIINTGTTRATDCGIAPVTSVSGGFSFQTTDPETNALTGTPDTSVDIAAGTSQSYVFTFTPTAEFLPIDVALAFDCTDKDPAPVVPGLNTLLLSSSSNAVPDLTALAATPTGDGIVNLPGSLGANAFAVATVNVGSQDTITAAADTGDTLLPVEVLISESDPVTAECLSAPGSSVTTPIDTGATSTFSIFVTGAGTVPFDPATNRIFVRFRDASSVTRGATSVAVRTTP